jgi:hypothetical protein
MGELLLLLLLVVILLLRIAWETRRRRLLNGRSAHCLSTHHGLDFFHAHDLPSWRGLLRGNGGLRGWLPLSGRLFGLETPDICARL